MLPSWAVDVLTDRSFHTVAAKLIIATELFIAVGLWSRTRYAAVWVAICFHVAIELSAEVQVFSFLAIGALVIWAVPSTRDRLLLLDPESPSQRWLATAVRSLDWLARFRVEWRQAGSSRCGRRPGWARRRRRVGGVARVEQAACDGVVRAASARVARFARRRRTAGEHSVNDETETEPIRRGRRAALAIVVVGRCRRDRLRCARAAGATARSRQRRASTRRHASRCSGSSAISSPTVHGSTSTTRTATSTSGGTTSFVTPARSWASTRRPRPGTPTRWRAPTAACRGPASTSSSTTTGPRWSTTGGRRPAARRCSPPVSSSVAS